MPASRPCVHQSPAQTDHAPRSITSTNHPKTAKLGQSRIGLSHPNQGIGITTSLTHDPISRLATYDHSSLVNAGFTYNPASQLATREVSNTAFTYKTLVDRSLTYAVNNLNQYTAATGTTPATFAHDLNGNMTSDGAGGSYVYDALNRLTSASGTNSATLVYGPKGSVDAAPDYSLECQLSHVSSSKPDRQQATQLSPYNKAKASVRFRDIAAIALVSAMGAKADVRIGLRCAMQFNPN